MTVSAEQLVALALAIADLLAERDLLRQENAALRQQLADHPANRETPDAG